ncbi:hypothetical protein HMPREF9628_01520 [Peptoanaerobacter stomatis]|uniref:Glycosyl transferase family 1 domain-containing protein n=1 Tax=Peptoanaerobacter stomatis TaxID=796937 RepID=G9XCE3_9FIRM|nr:hypothetical protein [Peptoanaerobacter stomatis]EHL19336.1 hypothetical protein HMPREF9628_01520 [Peptoanaerobacter stomatis]
MKKNILIIFPLNPFFKTNEESYLLYIKNILEKNGHNVQICTIPISYNSIDSFWKQAYQWSLFDFSEEQYKDIDMVICTKWPSYYIKHPNKKLLIIEDINTIIDMLECDEDEKKALIMSNKKAIMSANYIYTSSKYISKKLESDMGVASKPLYFFNTDKSSKLNKNIDEKIIISIDNKVNYNKSLIDSIEDINVCSIIITTNKKDYNSLKQYCDIRGIENAKIKFFNMDNLEDIELLEESASMYFYGVDKFRNFYPIISSHKNSKPIICVRGDNGNEFIERLETEVIDNNHKDIRKAIENIIKYHNSIEENDIKNENDRIDINYKEIFD